MRISTTWTNQVAVNNMLNQQANLNATQTQISSGKKYTNPAENPVVAASLVNFDQNIAETQQYQVNINAAQASLQLEGSSLSSAISVLQSARDLTVQSLNSSNAFQNKQQIAVQISQLNQQLLNLANTKDAEGQYIFGGTNSSTPPYTVSNGVYTYNGNTSENSTIIGPENRQVTNGDNGTSVFGAINTTNPPPTTPTSAGTISNVFQALSQLTSDLNAGTPNSGSIQDIDNALNNIETVNASVGARVQVLTSQQNINSQTILDNQTTSSTIGDVNLATAISQLQLQQTTLQAAQQTFIKVSGLSIFQYM